MRAASLLALLLAMALAGCSGSGTDPADTDDAGGLAPSPPPALNITNSPPSANLTAASATGTAPFTAGFTLLASDGDLDGLSWSMDFEGDGTADANGTFGLDASGSYPGVLLNHTYTEAGSYNATLTVDDGEEAGSATAAIDVQAAPAALDQPNYQLTGTVTGAWANGYVGDPSDTTFEVVAVKSRMTLAFTEGPTGPDLDFYLLDPDGNQVAASNGFFVLDNLGEPDLVVEDPALLSKLGTWTVRTYAGAAAQGEYTIEVTFE